MTLDSVIRPEYESQSSPLTPSQLVTIFRLLLAARRAGKSFFAFFNCAYPYSSIENPVERAQGGENSGASQPHKHVQFLPRPETTPPPIERLALETRFETLGSCSRVIIPYSTNVFTERPFSLTRLPYANHVRRFPSDITFFEYDKLEATLSQAFMQLLDLVISTVRHDPDYPAGKLSYNVWITLEHLHLIPRRHEAYAMNDGSHVSINALGFAGMLLVKSEDELEAVKSEGIGKILRGVGLESIHEEQVQGTAAEAIDEVSIPPKGSVL